MNRRFDHHLSFQVKSILVNVFGGIVNCATVANGIVNAARSINITIPIIVRLEGDHAVTIVSLSLSLSLERERDFRIIVCRNLYCRVGPAIYSQDGKCMYYP